MSSWNAQGNYFGVFGTAEPDRGGWRFRDNMTAADRSERCEVLLGRLPDGGYSFSVTEAGSCQSDGGFGAAPLPNQKILFPARSRQGPMPRDKSMERAMSLESGRIDCAKPARGNLHRRASDNGIEDAPDDVARQSGELTAHATAGLAAAGFAKPA